MITNEFFGLIQCYTEQGICHFYGHEFNIMLMPVIYVAFFGTLIGLLCWIVYKVKFKQNPPII